MTATAPTASAVSLVEACADRRLFGLTLSERQVDLLRLIETHPLTVCAAGRQSGKSLLAAAALVHNLLLRPDLDRLAGSSPRYGLAIANSQTQAGITLGRDYPGPIVDHAKARDAALGALKAIREAAEED